MLQIIAIFLSERKITNMERSEGKTESCDAESELELPTKCMGIFKNMYETVRNEYRYVWMDG